MARGDDTKGSDMDLQGMPTAEVSSLESVNDVPSTFCQRSARFVPNRPRTGAPNPNRSTEPERRSRAPIPNPNRRQHPITEPDSAAKLHELRERTAAGRLPTIAFADDPCRLPI